VVEQREAEEPDLSATGPDAPQTFDDEPEREPKKFYVDGGEISIVHELVSELDPRGRQLRVIEYKDYTGEQVRKLYGTAAGLQSLWKSIEERAAAIEEMESRGIDFDELARQLGQPEADPLDLLTHVAFNAPLRTRRERADVLLKDRADYFDRYGTEARAILEALVEKYAEYGQGAGKVGGRGR